MDDEEEISKAGYLLAEFLCSTLFPKSDTWEGARHTYIWEHNALCWLHRNRGRVKWRNAWTAMLLEEGYPPKPFLDARGGARPAGFYWNASMAPREDGSASAHAAENTEERGNG